MRAFQVKSRTEQPDATFLDIVAAHPGEKAWTIAHRMGITVSRALALIDIHTYLTPDLWEGDDGGIYYGYEEVNNDH